MSKISDDKILEHIADGITQLTPDRAEELWAQPVVSAKGSEWYLDSSLEKPHMKRRKHYIGALAACFALCIISAVLFQYMPSAAVYLDVNPSVELKVNYRNKVTTVIPSNSDAVEILEDMDLKGTDLDVALYAILGSMVHHGYLTTSTDTILISGQSANTNRANELELEVTDMVSKSLEQMIQSGEVLSQQINQNDIDQADPDYSGTPGKETFIDDLEDKYPQLKQDKLDELTVDEIISHLNQEGLDYSEYQDDEDDDDEDDDDGEDDDDDGEDDDDDEDDDNEDPDD